MTEIPKEAKTTEEIVQILKNADKTQEPYLRTVQRISKIYQKLEAENQKLDIALDSAIHKNDLLSITILEALKILNEFPEGGTVQCKCGETFQVEPSFNQKQWLGRLRNALEGKAKSVCITDPVQHT